MRRKKRSCANCGHGKEHHAADICLYGLCDPCCRCNTYRERKSRKSAAIRHGGEDCILETGEEFTEAAERGGKVKKPKEER